MKIRITFERPYFAEEFILALTPHDLDDFYVEANEVNRLDLFFMLEVSLHKFQREKLFMAYYLLLPQQFLLQRVKQIWRLSCIACHGLRLTELLPLYVFRESCTVAVQSRKSANI